VHGTRLCRAAFSVEDLPTTGPKSLDPTGDVASGDPDDEMPHRSDHEQQPERVADETRDTEEDPTGEDDQPVEQLPGRNLAASEPLLGVEQHAEADALDDERTECTDGDQQRERPQEADVSGDCNEGGDLRSYEEQASKEEHIGRVTPERPRWGRAAPARGQLICTR
jgi:hypothetical protein